MRAVLLSVSLRSRSSRPVGDKMGDKRISGRATAFAIFYLKGITPPEIDVVTIYRGVVPFILLQLLGLAIIFNWKNLVTWLPAQAYG